VLEQEDPDDRVANFGLGKIYLDRQQPEQALPYLSKATEVDPLYSSAWLQLGKCLEALGQTERALAVYREGMAAAARKGDLMPLKEMEQRLQVLNA
jgi:Tfp pilus assembly protein PilF